MVKFYFSIRDSSGNPVTTAFVVGVDKSNQPYYAPTDLNGNAVVSIPANIWGYATTYTPWWQMATYPSVETRVL